jgi:DNA-binding GntR family transcriptional regulator
LAQTDGDRHQLGPILPQMLVSLADAVTESLREAILSGRLKAGERILQERVATDLGVSRQPVREAVNRLHAEGLVTELNNGRIIVRVYTPADICENYLLRRVLESEAARIAATTMTDNEINELANVNEALKAATAAREPNKILEFNDRFHRLIRVSTKHGTLEAFINSLWQGLAIATPLSIPGRAEHSIVEHDLITRALKARDPEAAARAMAEHIDSACQDFLRQNGLPLTTAPVAAESDESHESTVVSPHSPTSRIEHLSDDQPL